jgi:hypothetical protein
MMSLADTAILDTLERTILTPERILEAVDLVARKIAEQPEDLEAQREQATQDLRKVEGKIRNLTAAIADGAALPSVLDALKTAEREKADIQARIEHLDGLSCVPTIGTERLRDALTERLTEWQRMLRAEPTLARQILRKVLPGRVTFEPTEGGTLFYGEAQADRIIAGLIPGGNGNSREGGEAPLRVKRSDSTPRERLSGGASQLNPSHRSGSLSPTGCLAP